MHRRSAFALVSFALAVVTASLAGCAGDDPPDFRPSAAIRLAATRPAPATTQAGIETLQQFRVAVTPPAGWRLGTTSIDDRHEHVTWVSPSGNTALGIVYFRLPWPVGHDLAFRYGFLAEMEKKEKSAEVLEKRWDPDIEGLRFVVNSPNFQVTAKFLVRGLRGFATYTGTKRASPIDAVELRQAAAARETATFAGEVSRPQMNADERR